MKKKVVRNFHLPLPDELYQRLRVEGERLAQPTTALARQATEFWLRQTQKQARHEAIAAYARACAGTPADLDGPLEAAAVAHMLDETEGAQ